MSNFWRFSWALGAGILLPAVGLAGEAPQAEGSAAAKPPVEVTRVLFAAISDQASTFVSVLPAAEPLRLLAAMEYDPDKSWDGDRHRLASRRSPKAPPRHSKVADDDPGESTGKAATGKNRDGKGRDGMKVARRARVAMGRGETVKGADPINRGNGKATTLRMLAKMEVAQDAGIMLQAQAPKQRTRRTRKPMVVGAMVAKGTEKAPRANAAIRVATSRSGDTADPVGRAVLAAGDVVSLGRSSAALVVQDSAAVPSAAECQAT